MKAHEQSERSPGTPVPPPPQRKTWLRHLLFALVGAAILLTLWLAPPARTPVLPRDKDHLPYFGVPRKEAERHCFECHGPDQAKPLPKTHPPTWRCLFCHRRVER